MEKSEVVAEINRMCGDVYELPNGWCHFVYHYLHYLYVPGELKSMIRILMPHVDDSRFYKKDTLEKVINETNREMMYVKVIILKNGSIAINYDHRIDQKVKADSIVPHMIETLNFAQSYLKKKMEMAKE